MGKVYINPPNLPTSIRGDGRYLMTLLNNFVSSVSDQVNYINGYVTTTSVSSIPVPKYFYLEFNNSGLEFSWSAVDVDNFDHYELRLNTQVGNNIGLLAKTTDLKCSPALENRTGTAYLYVVLKSGDYSNPYKLNYSKAIPAAPQNVAVSKVEEGTLIFFDSIPSDCMGAVVYINNIPFETLSSTFLYTGGATVSDVLVSYYDSFGCGDTIDAYFDPPLINNFFVERNDCHLHFYWDAVSLYNAHYIIKRNTSNDWDTGEIVCDVATTTYNCIFPNVGSYYFMIKVFDEHGNTSDECTFVTLDTVPDIQRNVIIENYQHPKFLGVKNNLTYDSSTGSLVLPQNVISGFYCFNSVLPQQYRARNWIDYNVFSFSEFNCTWGEADFDWESEKAGYTWTGALSSSAALVRSEIAPYIGADPNVFDHISFDNTLISSNGVVPSYKSISYSPSYFTDGALISCFSYVRYSISLPLEFSCVFSAKVVDIASGLLLSFTGNSGSMSLSYSYSTKSFVFSYTGSDDLSVSVPFFKNDILYFGISQFDNTLKLLVKPSSGSASIKFCSITPVQFTTFTVGKKIEVGS